MILASEQPPVKPLTATTWPPRDGNQRAVLCAAVLEALLTASPRSWPELQCAGLSRREIGVAATDIVQDGRCRVVIGPLLVQLEGDDA